MASTAAGLCVEPVAADLVTTLPVCVCVQCTYVRRTGSVWTLWYLPVFPRYTYSSWYRTVYHRRAAAAPDDRSILVPTTTAFQFTYSKGCRLVIKNNYLLNLLSFVRLENGRPVWKSKLRNIGCWVRLRHYRCIFYRATFLSKINGK